jgi:hypothetical protein
MGTTTMLGMEPVQFVIQMYAFAAKSLAGKFWELVVMFWAKYWPYIILVLTLIVVYEILTWNGNWHYNSANGFSPGFNKLVGSGVFALYSGIFFTFVHFVFGNDIYLDQIWPYLIHAFAFPLTWVTLRKIGFWVY